MAEKRVVPSGKVYRQMFDAQAHLSLSLHESRRRRVTKEGYFSGDDPVSRDTDSGPHQSTGANQCSEDKRNQQFSRNRPSRTEHQVEAEEVQGLPDNVVSAKTGSDIITRLAEKKQRDHSEAVAQLQRDLSMISARFEPLLKQTGEGLLLRLLESDDELAKLMQKTENVDDLGAFSYEDLQDLWNIVSYTSATRRKWIEELDETFIKYETERASMISALLKKYVRELEKIAYMRPFDVHRLINSEAMRINQSLLANKQAIARLHLNLMENDILKESQYRLKWEDKLQDWKRMKVLTTVSKFKDFIHSPQIQRPHNVQETLCTLWKKQEMYNEQRIKILEQIRTMIPPRCSKSLVSEWYSALSSVSEQIDCMHIKTVAKLHKYYETTWQECLDEVEQFKNEVSTYGFTSNEIQDIVNAELLPETSKCQMQTEERLAAMDKAFEDLAKTAALLSKSMFKFMNGTARLWEVHTAGLQKREQQLQDHLDDLRSRYDLENQKKEAQLHVLMDKLRQESTEEALKTTLENALGVLEEVKDGYMTFNKDGVHTVESYPAMVLEELHTYSSLVSQYFDVKEVYSQDIEELQKLHPSLKFVCSDVSLNASIKLKKTLGSPGRKHCTDVSLKAHSRAHCSLDSVLTKEHFDTVSHELKDSQAIETFITASGNTFSDHSFVMSCDSEVDVILVEVERVLFPKDLALDLQKIVKEEFLNRIKERYQEVLNNTVTFVEGKKEELKSELELRLHLLQSQAKRIEMDIHNIRAAELSLHQDCVDRHCKGILQALADLRTDFTELQVRQQELTEGFHTQIYNMEETFKTATKSDKLVKLCASLQTSLTEHTNVIQEQQRHFRQNTEDKFEGLREANSQFMKSFKLFSEGGNFTPIEIEKYQKHLKKTAKDIDSTDEALMLEMESTESKWIEQAKHVSSKFEEKFHVLTVDLMFLEKIQRVLTNTQVKLKSEVVKSNMQKKMINTMMSELEELIHACSKPTPDKKVVTSEDIISMTNSLIEELKKRCQYLDCFLDPSMAVPLPDVPLQGSFAVATRPRSRKHENITVAAGSDLLQPSSRDVDFLSDTVVGVIKDLLRFSKPKAGHEIEAADKVRQSAAGTVTARPRSPVGPGQRSRGSQGRTGLETGSSQSMRRYCKPNRLEKRFQVFGPKPEDQQGNPTFKGLMCNILWKANDVLLQVAEEYYKRKERRPVSRPQHIQDSFGECAEELNKRLLVYQSQSQDYRNRCVQEFQEQLINIEECMCKMPEVILKKLTDQHIEDLSNSVVLIQQQFEQFQQQTEQKKKNHISRLRVRLSHLDYEEELNRLITDEQDRQEEQKKVIQNTRLELQACIRKSAEEFVTALATLTESLLFQLDNILTTEEIQVDEKNMENSRTLFHRKNTAALQRGSRSWQGINYFGGTDNSSANQQQRQTATITTVKTTMVHLKAIEVRNALHQSFEQQVMEELKRMEKSSQQQLAELRNWQEHWRHQLKILSTLN
ncbi:coiled-coil domain-containing protein 180 isoform X1 [Astyanax mexicanus]|uniref:coiled-coil domain-containing protein 180 isoform X1 n=1 Tax=Astyanax mexicanus TaxID=7994 RepID=UPI0020CADBF6|nr:coiled-coil domain-containing protein 180 isoform X1 [Astyanax mexicanus]